MRRYFFHSNLRQLLGVPYILSHGFGKLEVDDVFGRPAGIQPEEKGHVVGIHGGQFNAVDIQ